MTTAAVSTPGAVLAIGAHPDDIEFHCGATLAKWAESGASIHFVICTDGAKGTWDTQADPTGLVATRQSEQRKAASLIHAKASVDFLDQVDGELVNSVALRGRLARLIRKYKPDVVLGHDPWRRWRMHPDHRAAGYLTVDAVVAARDPHYHREHIADGLTHHRPNALLLFECEEPNHGESITAAHLDAKVNALLAHQSQHETTMTIDGDDDGTQAGAFKARILAEAHDHATRFDQTSPDGGAEVFRWMDPAS